MQDVLDKINKIVGVRGCLLVGADGLPVLTALPDDLEPNALAARTAALAATLGGTLEKLSMGTCQRYVLNGAGGAAVLLEISPEVRAMVILRKGANMGLVLVELKQAARELAMRIKR